MFELFNTIHMHQGGAEYEFHGVRITYSKLGNNMINVAVYGDYKIWTGVFNENCHDVIQRDTYSQVDEFLLDQGDNHLVWHQLVINACDDYFGKHDEMSRTPNTLMLKFGQVTIIAECDTLYNISYTASGCDSDSYLVFLDEL